MKKAIIIGATSGIGKSLADLLSNQNKMPDEDFAPHQEALDLKHLGFDEAISTYYSFPDIELSYVMDGHSKVSVRRNSQFGHAVSAPTYSQAFRFFRKRYGLHTWVACRTLDNGKTVYIGNGRTIPNTFKDGFIVDIIPYEPKDTPEEAELYLLRKLIEIAKKQCNEKV